MGYKEKVRGYDVVSNLLPKVKFEIVVSSQEWAERTVDAICRTAHTGEHGDGKIFVYELMDVVRTYRGITDRRLCGRRIRRSRGKYSL